VQLLFAKPGYRGRPWRAALDPVQGPAATEPVAETP
jgi:hypothetical protein